MMIVNVMVRLRCVILLLAVLLICIIPISVSAQSLTDVQSFMQSGQYDEAAELGETLNTAESLSLASEALARKVMLGNLGASKSLAKEAKALAEKALDIDPTHQNARLQFVITDGFVARNTGDVSAWFKKLPQKSLAYIQAYRKDFSDDPKGDALMGAWHLEIIRKAGAENAMKWFGARADYGKGFFEKALNQAPNDPIISLNYAFALIALNDKAQPIENSTEQQDWSRAKALMEKAQLMPAPDDLTRKMQAKAAKALSLFETPNALKVYVDEFFEGKLG